MEISVLSSNGIGPSWFPAWLRRLLTKFGRSWFKEASWEKHDEGYEAGEPARHVCDLKFFQAMVRDASETKPAWRVNATIFLAFIGWVMVRLFGWMSYNRKKT
jgi:hypothetical protein